MSDTILSSIADSALFKQAALINGEWVAAFNGSTLDVDNPASGEIIGTVPNCGAQETEAAIAAADVAFKSWRRTTAGHRAEALMRWYDLMIKHRDDLAMIMTLEQGKPLAEASGEITYGASFVKWFAEEARRVYGETIPAPVVDRRIIVIKQPIGVAVAITPWNFPTAMIARKAAPAIAAGCTIVIKPSELTPYSALALGVLAERAGIPKGVINILPGDAIAIGGAMTASKTVRKLSFTGSTRVGKILMEQSAATMKRLSLELGGNAPLIVFDDADIERAIDGVMASKFRNGGQTCVCANRIYVQDGIYDKFSARLAEVVNALQVGDGLNEGSEIGPMINNAALDKIEDHVSDAVAKGAKIITGGHRITDGSRYYKPTVLTGATHDMQLSYEETFGPVAPLFRFKTEQEVVAAANDTDFGLAAYVFTNDLSRSLRVSEDLEVGMVGLNTGAIATEAAPFGGVKDSGLGREGARQGLDEFLEEKAIHIDGI